MDLIEKIEPIILIFAIIIGLISSNIQILSNNTSNIADYPSASLSDNILFKQQLNELY